MCIRDRCVDSDLEQVCAADDDGGENGDVGEESEAAEDDVGAPPKSSSHYLHEREVNGQIAM